MFPPKQFGGLIEATTRAYRMLCGSWRFRRSNSAASLKHVVARRIVGWCRWFPPKQFGGLIEAYYTLFISARGRSGFRRSNSAASLKRRPARFEADIDCLWFPPKQFGGLIEACRSC